MSRQEAETEAARRQRLCVHTRADPRRFWARFNPELGDWVVMCNDGGGPRVLMEHLP